MECAWSLWSDTNQTICNTKNDKWFVWRDGLCEPSLHHSLYYILSVSGLCEVKNTIHPFTQTITSHKPSLHINHLSHPSHIPDNMKHRELWMVCVKGCNTENDKWSLHTNHPFTQTIYHSLYWPSLHTNHPSTQTIPLHKPSLSTIHPFTKTIYYSLYYIPSHLPDNMNYREWLMVCVNGWFV